MLQHSSQSDGLLLRICHLSVGNIGLEIHHKWSSHSLAKLSDGNIPCVLACSVILWDITQKYAGTLGQIAFQQSPLLNPTECAIKASMSHIPDTIPVCALRTTALCSCFPAQGFARCLNTHGLTTAQECICHHETSESCRRTRSCCLGWMPLCAWPSAATISNGNRGPQPCSPTCFGVLCRVRCMPGLLAMHIAS